MARTKRNGGLFGKPTGYAMDVKPEMLGPIGGFGGGTFNMDGAQQYAMPSQWDIQTNTPQERPGFMAKGGTGRAIAGTIGDYLMQRQGMAPVYAPAMMQQQQARAEASAAQRKRAMDLADLERKEQIKSRYNTNDTIEDFNWYQGLSDEEKRAYHQMRPQMVQIDNGDGTKTIVPYNPYGGQQGPLPTFTQEDWEAAGSNAGGGF